MTQNFLQISQLYLENFLNKFLENEKYAWVSTLNNAKTIFYSCQNKQNFEGLIFYCKFEEDLNFFTSESECVFEDNDFSDVSLLLNNIEKTRILKNFQNHVISTWDFDFIQFSCGVSCILYNLNSPEMLDQDLPEGVFDFLLKNKLKFQFYYFLKKNNILQIHKRNFLLSLEIVYLGYCLKPISGFNLYSEENFLEFLDNFILIWDLLGLSITDYNLIKLKTLEEKNFSFLIQTLKSYRKI